MKTKNAYYLLGLLSFFFMSCQFSFGDEAKVKRTKEINKTWSWTPEKTLHLDNKYGSIQVTHWDKKEVALHIVIEVGAKNAERADKLLDAISVECSEERNLISAETRIANVTFSGSRSMNIRYEVKMPAEGKCDFEQKYGNVQILEPHSGDCNLEVKYGNINLDDMTGRLEIESHYGSVEAGDTRDLTAEIKYGNMSLGRTELLILDSGYSNVDIKLVEKKLIVEDLSYGKLGVTRVSEDFELITGEAQYSKVKLGVSEGASFRFSCDEGQFGDCKIRGFKSMSESGSDNKVECTVNGGRNGEIRFDVSSYSDIVVSAL